MADSGSEGGPRRSGRIRSPTKKIAQYDEKIEGDKKRWKENEHKKTVEKKCLAGKGLKLVESGRSPLSTILEKPTAGPQSTGAMTVPNPNPTTPETMKGKGKGKGMNIPEEPQKVDQAKLRNLGPDLTQPTILSTIESPTMHLECVKMTTNPPLVNLNAYVF
ncbi:hypothetical protein FRC11_007703 [Ceratobasidium sp. 423]|nr:hypothetical protein FRC11_007703 [Ceratobasidium sp. 423]